MHLGSVPVGAVVFWGAHTAAAGYEVSGLQLRTLTSVCALSPAGPTTRASLHQCPVA